jgi:hypothetical protein
LYEQTQFGAFSSNEGFHGEQTKPVFAGWDTLPLGYSIVPPFPSDAYRAKQSQFPDDAK